MSTPLTTETVSLLRKVRDSIGYLGSGEFDTTQFYCEHCKATHANWGEIRHTAECLVTRIDAHLAALQETPRG